ncbi:MAG: HAMP domain-containing sensor histidine kinase [Lautropia sp.]|nr:HAMP domain-containing sensor histidine kinase [Lautropia sp.]
MRRLSLTIFLSLLSSLLLMAVAVSVAWHWRVTNRAEEQEHRFNEALAAAVIPAADDGIVRLQESLMHWHRRLRVDLTVVDAGGRVLAQAGRAIPLPVAGEFPRIEQQGASGRDASVLEPAGPVAGGEGDRRREIWRNGIERNEEAGKGRDGTRPGERAEPGMGMRDGRRGDGVREPGGGRRAQPMEAVLHQVALPDARTLLIRSWRPQPPRPPVSAPVALALLFVAVGLAAWPVSRRITRRLESLQRTVDRQAAGDLKIRAEVQGRDEVAALAHSFNRAAGQIEALVNRQDALLHSQRRLLANASHELRSPLARIRMATELMLESPDDVQQHAAEVRQSIHELDELVEEILLASRLDTQADADGVMEPVDLIGLAAEEAARTGADLQVEGEIPELRGELRLLRRMLRNLLENARRYHPAGDEPVVLRLVSRAEAQPSVPASGEPSRFPATEGVAPDEGRGEAQRAYAAGALRIEVLDRGPGVPDADRERIFEAFYRVDGHAEKAGNVGLGLALVRQIARRHGGDAHHEARAGGGSCFVVSLP